MRSSVRCGAIVIASVLSATCGAQAQEMQMPKQEEHHQMNIPVVKPEFPRMGRAQENAKGALITLEQVQKIATESNPTLRQAEAEIRAATARQRQSGLYPNPTLAYTGDEIRGGSVGGGKQGAKRREDGVSAHARSAGTARRTPRPGRDRTRRSGNSAAADEYRPSG